MTNRTTWAGVGSLLAASVSVFTFVAGDDDGPSATPLDGATLFRAKGCAGCHRGPDTESPATGLPDLSDAARWAGERSGLTAAEYLEQSIRDPVAIISPEFSGPSGPVKGMPTLAVSDAEVEALVDYLLSDPNE